MKSLGELKRDSQTILEEMMKTLDTDNVTNEMFRIQQNPSNKKQVPTG